MKIFNQFNNQEIKKTFKKLYFTSADNAPIRYSLMHDEFTRIFGSEDYRIFSVSGRSEIGGNHTDHNNGRVLAAAVSCDTVCFAKKRNDMKVRMISYGYDGEFNVDLNDLAVNKDQYDTTNALIRGVAAGMKKNGHEICGFDAYVHSTVLSGSGLSSSAAFEVLL
jgi:galactokinase